MEVEGGRRWREEAGGGRRGVEVGRRWSGGRRGVEVRGRWRYEGGGNGGRREVEVGGK